LQCRQELFSLQLLEPVHRYPQAKHILTFGLPETNHCFSTVRNNFHPLTCYRCSQGTSGALLLQSGISSSYRKRKWLPGTCGSLISCRGQHTGGDPPAWLWGGSWKLVAMEPQWAICYGILQKGSNYNGFFFSFFLLSQNWDQWKVSLEILMNHQDL
jgi:hypothetical protein